MQAVQAFPASFRSSLRPVCCQYLDARTEPGAGPPARARPMEFSRTRNPSRPKRASETQGKRARFKENADQQSANPRGGKGVNAVRQLQPVP